MKTALFYATLIAMMPAGLAIALTAHLDWTGRWEDPVTLAGLTMILGGPLLAALAYTSHNHHPLLRWSAAMGVIALLALSSRADDRYADIFIMAAAMTAIAPAATTFIFEGWRNRDYAEPPPPTFGEMILREAMTAEGLQDTALSYEDAVKAAPGLAQATAETLWSWQPGTSGRRTSDLAREAAAALSDEDREALKKAANGREQTP